MNRLLSDPDLSQFRAFIARMPGTGTGNVPEDLGLLLGHMDAQMAELNRARQRDQELTDLAGELLDYAERGGSDDYRDRLIARARAVRGG